MNRTLLGVFCGLFIFGGVANAASFDCAKAKSFSEKTICGNSEYSQLDEELAKVFKEARNAAPDRNEFKALAKNNYKKLNQCKTEACVGEWLHNSIGMYQNLASGAVASAPAPAMDQARSNQDIQSRQKSHGPVVFGEIVFGQDYLADVKKKLDRKPGCTYYDDPMIKGRLHVKNCYKFPGNPTVTIMAPTLVEPVYEAEVTNFKQNPIPNCRSTYLSLLKKTWGQPTGDATVEHYGEFTYWERDGIAVTLSGDDQFCQVGFYGPEAWEYRKEQIEKNKNWEEKPMDTL
ncbi:MAG: hypothetical protein LUC43_07835 [Burkholderiales bacterium]|nr:hypothetical protein [Burkholderiales bacterium]